MGVRLAGLIVGAQAVHFELPLWGSGPWGNMLWTPHAVPTESRGALKGLMQH